MEYSSMRFFSTEAVWKKHDVWLCYDTISGRYCWENDRTSTVSGVIPCAWGDHSLVFCVFKAGVTKAPPPIIEYRSYKRYNKESFLQDLRNNNWSAAV
jgi:hypothetical protein